MANFSNIPTGLKITTQIPLNVKEFCKDEATLAYLGVDDNLAFTYHDQLEVLCLAEKSIYIWREVQVGEENTGLVPLDFTYPTGLSNVYDIDYSGKKYNFFLKEYVTIDTLQDLIEIENVGTGAEIYKGFNSTTNKHEIKTVIIDSQLSPGESFVRDIQENTNDITVRVKKLISNNLTISSTDEEVRIETPETASIPALYVNNLYIPTEEEFLAGNTKGDGTLAKPFTDTVTAYVAGVPTITANTAIQNALDVYVGSGTRLSPELVGQKIIVQDNTTSYNFPENFGYSRLDIEINANVTHTDSGYLIDMDNSLHFNDLGDNITVTIGEDYLLAFKGEGLNNSGSDVTTFNYAQSRQIYLKGNGTLYFPDNNITKYAINSDILSTGNNNDGGVTFRIDCRIRCDYQGVLKIGGTSRVYNYNDLFAGIDNVTIDPSIKAFLLLGGQFRNFKTSSINFSGGNRTDGFVFTPTDGFIPGLIGQSTTIVSTSLITNLFNKTTTDTAYLNFVNSDSSVLFNVTNIFESPNLWNVTFNRNIFESGSIDSTKADLTSGNLISAVNSIGRDTIENLRTFDDRNTAILAGLPLYSAYIKTSGVAYPSTSGWVRDIVLPI
jgi:hypothetical protein